MSFTLMVPPYTNMKQTSEMMKSIYIGINNRDCPTTIHIPFMALWKLYSTAVYTRKDTG